MRALAVAGLGLLTGFVIALGLVEIEIDKKARVESHSQITLTVCLPGTCFQAPWHTVYPTQEACELRLPGVAKQVEALSLIVEDISCEQRP